MTVFVDGYPWIVLVAISLLISLFFVRLRLRLIYGDQQKKGTIEIALSVAGLPYFRLPNPRPSKKGKGGGTGKPRFDVSKIIKHMLHEKGVPAPGLFPSDRPLITFQTIESLNLRTMIGTGDASSTAIAAGVVWGIKSALISMLFQQAHFVHRPMLEVIPNFDKPCLDIYVYCIFRFTIGEIIHAAWPRFFDAERLKGGGITNAK